MSAVVENVVISVVVFEKFYTYFLKVFNFCLKCFSLSLFFNEQIYTQTAVGTMRRNVRREGKRERERERHEMRNRGHKNKGKLRIKMCVKKMERKIYFVLELLRIKKFNIHLFLVFSFYFVLVAFAVASLEIH